MRLHVGVLRGEAAATAVERKLLRAEGHRRAWEVHTLDLSYTGVTDVSALAGCSSLHMLNLALTDVTDVPALAQGWSM